MQLRTTNTDKSLQYTNAFLRINADSCKVVPRQVFITLFHPPNDFDRVCCLWITSVIRKCKVNEVVVSLVNLAAVTP